MNIDLGNSTLFEINEKDKIVCTHFGEIVTCATRPVDFYNVREARWQGYKGTDEEVVWESLVDHELLHNIVPRALWDEYSKVLQDVAGIKEARYCEKLYEEALCLSFQFYMNTNIKDRVLENIECWKIEKLLEQYHPSIEEEKTYPTPSDLFAEAYFKSHQPKENI